MLRYVLLGLVLGVVFLQRGESYAATEKEAPPRNAEDAVTPVEKDVERHNLFLKEAADHPGCKLLFLGSSTTDFWPKRGKSSWEKLAAYEPLDFGVSGDRTEHVIWRITHGELEGIHPKVVVIQIGTNNIGHSAEEKPEWVAAGIGKIVQIVRSKLPESKILLLGIFPCDVKGSRKRDGVAAVNAIVAKLNEPPVIRYLDISAAFLDTEGEIPKDVMPDHQHPSAKGYEIWYEKMLPVLKDLMG